jgi:hypothetical protein
MTTTFTPTSYFPRSSHLEHYRSGRAGPVRNDGEMREIDGIAVDITGMSSKVAVAATFKPADGVQIIRRSEGPPSLLAPSTMAATIQLQSLPKYSQAELDAAKAKGGGGYVTSVGEVTEMYFTPAGGEPQSVEGLGYLPGDVLQNGGQAEYVKSQVARARGLAEVETKLSEQYGADVKLAYDPMAREYIMLRPGQFGYDRVTSARDVYAQVLQDQSKMG